MGRDGKRFVGVGDIMHQIKCIRIYGKQKKYLRYIECIAYHINNCDIIE